MAQKEKISLYNLSLEKTVLDLHKYLSANDMASIKAKKYSLFYPMIGKDYYEQKQLMVYSQYAQDWTPTFKMTNNKAQIETLVKKSFAYATPTKVCPLDWVNKQWIKQGLFRSFLWNITYKLAMEQYGRTDEDWNQIVAWSNIMKITPSTPATISDQDFIPQLSNSAHLFKEELSLLQPKNVILITNLDKWAAPLLKQAGIRYTEVKDSYVQATAAYRGSRLIITERPFAGNHLKFIDDVRAHML